MLFERVISLGWFCSVASEIKRIGLRDGSYPFDWLLTHNLSNVLKILDDASNVEMFLKNEDMLQYEGDASKWFNKQYQISLFHDFDKYKKMIDQLDIINEKYQRRLHRLHACKGPTLYIRYIKNIDEANYIVKNEQYINYIIKKKNTENSIFYIAHPDFRELMKSVTGRVFYVENDKNDCVCREFLKKLPELENYMTENVMQPSLDYLEKSLQNNNKIDKIGYKAVNSVVSKFRKQAINDNQFHQEGVLESCKNNTIVLFTNKIECSGCGVCQALCPRSAINMKEIEGFYYPVIIPEKCIQCYNCIHICLFKASAK